MRFFNRIGFLLLFELLVACSTDKEDVVFDDEIDVVEEQEEEVPEPPRDLTSLELEFLNEYEYITFNLAPDTSGADFNEKWEAEIKMFLDGELPDGYRDNVETEIEALELLVDNQLSVSLVNSKEESNLHLIYGDKELIREVWPDMYEYIGDINFRGYALFRSANGFKIVDGRIWVRTPTMPLFRHEVGHVLGLGHPSSGYCEGDILQNQSFMCSFLKEDLSIFDEAILKTLYNPNIEAGKTFAELKPVIEELFRSNVILVE